MFEQTPTQGLNHNRRTKSLVFIGIVLIAAVVAGVIVLRQTSEPQSEEYFSPALNASKQRTKANSPTTQKKPANTQ